MSGQARVASVPTRFNEQFTVTGINSGDSVRMLLRAVEDADIHIEASVTANHLAGRMWLNEFRAMAREISLDRQPAQ